MPGGQKGLKRFFRTLGPGLITGASDDDPACIGAYSRAGAAFGFSFLWVPFFIFPLMFATQYITARIGIVTGKGLSGVLKAYYPKYVLYPVIASLAAANTIEAGANLGAMAAAAGLIFPVNTIAFIILTAACILLFQYYGRYSLIRKTFKWATLALLAYIGAGVLSGPDAWAVLRGTFVPEIRFEAEYLSFLVALFGASISPYIFFWLVSQEVEEEYKASGSAAAAGIKPKLKKARVDISAGMLFANLIVYFVMLSMASAHYEEGIRDIGTAAEAARALKPLAGRMAEVLWALGLLGVGFISIPVLTGSAGYAVAEAFGWKQSMDAKPRQAKGFYAVITAATVIGVALNFFGINPIRALFWVEVINGVLSPAVLVIILVIGNNPLIMGERKNGLWANLLGWFTAVVMLCSAIGLGVVWLMKV